jgi:septum formation protein
MAVADQKIYLASKSPRRRELLRQIGIEFEILMLREGDVRDGAVSEIVLPGEAPEDYVARVAREKAESGAGAVLWRKLPQRPVLASDTTVTLDGLILGKPANMEDAVSTLKLLSGRTHQVLTSVAVMANGQMFEAMQRSEVTFGELSEHTLRAYCALSEPYDKAGGYAVQGYAAQFIERITGSYSGIMGLPLFETTQLLQKAGIKIL